MKIVDPLVGEVGGRLGSVLFAEGGVVTVAVEGREVAGEEQFPRLRKLGVVVVPDTVLLVVQN